MTVTAEVQKLAPDAMVELYKLDMTALGGDILYFHGDTVQGPIWFGGTQYLPWPIEASGFARTTDKQPTPKLMVANLQGEISALCVQYGDLVGSKLTRIRTFGKFLDAQNFGKTNKLIWSEDFTQATWTKNSVTVAANTTVAPDGMSTADTLTATANGNNQGYVSQAAVKEAGTYTFSIYLKKGTANYVTLQPNGDNGTACGFTLIVNMTNNTATYGNAYGTGISYVSHTITDSGNGWQRVAVTYTIPVTMPFCNMWVYPYRRNGTPEAAGLNTHVWGAMINVGTAAAPYEPKDATGRNPTANPNEKFRDEVWFIERKSAENNKAVEFEMASAFDLNGVQLPRRLIIANYCSWKSIGGYRGPNCNYTGPAVAKEDGTPTSVMAEDKCGGKLSDCKLRQWPDGVLNFGSYPAAALVRI